MPGLQTWSSITSLHTATFCWASNIIRSLGFKISICQAGSNIRCRQERSRRRKEKERGKGKEEKEEGKERGSRVSEFLGFKILTSPGIIVFPLRWNLDPYSGAPTKACLQTPFVRWLNLAFLRTGVRSRRYRKKAKFNHLVAQPPLQNKRFFTANRARSSENLIADLSINGNLAFEWRKIWFSEKPNFATLKTKKINDAHHWHLKIQSDEPDLR